MLSTRRNLFTPHTRLREGFNGKPGKKGLPTEERAVTFRQRKNHLNVHR